MCLNTAPAQTLPKDLPLTPTLTGNTVFSDMHVHQRNKAFAVLTFYQRYAKPPEKSFQEQKPLSSHCLAFFSI